MMRRLAPALMLLAVVTTGCSSASPSASPSPTASVESPSASPSASPEPENPDVAPCDSVAGIVSPVQTAAEALLTDSTGQTVDKAQLQSAVDVVAEVRPTASPELEAVLGPYADSIGQLNEAANGRSATPFDLGAYTDATVALSDYCTPILQ